jgi:hypothetical protein
VLLRVHTAQSLWTHLSDGGHGGGLIARARARLAFPNPSSTMPGSNQPRRFHSRRNALPLS